MRTESTERVPGADARCCLLELTSGARCIVRGFGHQVPPALTRRLMSMGLPIGAEAEMLFCRRHGPVLLRSKDARIALGRDEARWIEVERVHG